MAFNAYLLFHKDTKIDGESTSEIAAGTGAIELTDYSFGVSMPVTTSRSDGGGATVGRANFDVFSCNKNIDTSTTDLFLFCCKGTNIPKVELHVFRQGAGEEASGVVKYVVVVFKHVVITKVAITGGGEELPKEALEFNYGACEYHYHKTEHDTGKHSPGGNKDSGWSLITNKQDYSSVNWSAKLSKPS
jgi:type VI secretion system Hcp family effector